MYTNKNVTGKGKPVAGSTVFCGPAFSLSLAKRRRWRIAGNMSGPLHRDVFLDRVTTKKRGIALPAPGVFRGQSSAGSDGLTVRGRYRLSGRGTAIAGCAALLWRSTRAARNPTEVQSGHREHRLVAGA